MKDIISFIITFSHKSISSSIYSMRLILLIQKRYISTQIDDIASFKISINVLRCFLCCCVFLRKCRCYYMLFGIICTIFNTVQLFNREIVLLSLLRKHKNWKIPPYLQELSLYPGKFDFIKTD